MAVFKCKMCGATLDIKRDENIVECGYCGTKQTVPIIKTKEIEDLYDRANYFFHNNEYDKAADIYENISTENPYDPESYFMLALCKYGIEYVEDPKTKKRIPTLHRLHYESISNDVNFKKALKHADSTQKILYEQEAKYIDEVRSKILDISKKEKPYDVFICYKETDEKGQRTEDSVLAMDIYNELTKEGLKVFFAKVTLEDKLGIDYEPYIFAALNSAKVMVVVGTKPEYINSPWVRNEWTRFLDRINRNKANKNNKENCYIVPAYKGMSPYALPNEFSSVQAQDMSKVGAIQDLVHGIKKLVSKKEYVSQTAIKLTRKNKITILGALVILIVGIISTITLYRKSNVVVIRGTSYVANKNYETITFDGITDFDENDIFQLNKLKSIDNLYFKNCNFDNLNFLSKLQSAKGVKFDSKTRIQNFDIENECENIENFNYDYSTNSSSWDDLSFLKKMPNLVSLCVPICDDLTPLSSLGELESIELRSQKNSIVDNFQWCKGLEKVKKLTIKTIISDIKFVGDDYLKGIDNLKNIEQLYIRGTIGEGHASLNQKDINHISELITLKRLTVYLRIHGSDRGTIKISLKNFQKLEKIEYIYFYTTNIIDLSELNGLDNLKEIKIPYGRCHICNNDLTCLSNCKNLESIDIYINSSELPIFDNRGEFVDYDYFYYKESNKRKFSLKGIEKLNKLKILKICSYISHSNSGDYTTLSILDEELAKNNNRLEYSVEFK